MWAMREYRRSGFWMISKRDVWHVIDVDYLHLVLDLQGTDADSEHDRLYRDAWRWTSPDSRWGSGKTVISVTHWDSLKDKFSLGFPKPTRSIGEFLMQDKNRGFFSKS